MADVINQRKDMDYKSTHVTLFLIIALGIVSVFSTSSQALADEFNDKVGTRGYSFLKRSVGARASALGGAFTGMADDESALYYNPAGLRSLHGKHLMFSYQNFIAGINAGFLSFVTGDEESQTLGVYLNYMNYGEFIRTEAISGTELGKFGASSFVLGGAYSRSLTEKLEAGGAIKLIYANWDTFTSTGIAADIGLRYTLKRRIEEYDKRGFGHIGLSVLHLGKMLSAFTTTAEKDPLPAQIRFGAAGRPRGIPLVLAADLILPTDNDLGYAFGVEYAEIEKLALRAGWNSQGADYKTDFNESALAGFSFGLGFRTDRLNIDYSIAPMNDLGETHRITISHQLTDPLY